MLIRILLILCISISTIPTLYAAQNIEDTAWSLKRTLRIDESIRMDSGDILKMKKRRSELLRMSTVTIPNLFQTWNMVPATDKTLQYILTLQEYPLSCEIAAIKAVFNALGYARSENEIIRTLPHHNQPMNTRNKTWGDPDKEFVGLYKGSQAKKTGYGIYERGIARYFEEELQMRLPTLQTEAWNEGTRPEGYTDSTHLTHTLEALDAGKHIILWGDWCTAPEHEDGVVGRDKNFLKKVFPIPGKNTCKNYKAYRYYDWKTVDGKNIIALSGDHVFVLLGYIGSKESPSHIIVWDTDTGRHIYPTTEWMRKWGLMQHRSLIISK